MNNLELTGDFVFARLSRLEAIGIARPISRLTAHLGRRLDDAIARAENRLIEKVLLARLRGALKAARSESDARVMIDRFRKAYASGQMETLPGFLPSYSNGRHNERANTKLHRQRRATLSRRRPKLFYTVGGGFVLPPSRRQKNMVKRLAEVVGCEVVLGQHRLAPENPFPAAPEDIAKQFRLLAAHSNETKQPFMAADTAGASVTMGAIQILRDEGHDLPSGVILFCPWCDLSLSGWSYITGSTSTLSPFRMETAAFCARMYLQGQNPTDPLASAIFGDLTRFPPILIHTSRHDLHFDDALKLAESGSKVGCDVRLNYWDSPRHHLERLASADARRSFQLVRSFIDEITG